MREQTVAIVKLFANLMTKLAKKPMHNLSKGHVDSVVQKRKASYNMYKHPWAFADSDLLVLMAIAELTSENVVRPLAGKDENDLMLVHDVDLGSESSTASAAKGINASILRLEQARDLFVMIDAAATAVIAKSGYLALGFKSTSSQLSFDVLAQQRIAKLCKSGIERIKKILGRHENVLPILKQTQALHERTR